MPDIRVFRRLFGALYAVVFVVLAVAVRWHGCYLSTLKFATHFWLYYKLPVNMLEVRS